MTRVNDLPIPPLNVHWPEQLTTWPAYPILAVGQTYFTWDSDDDTVVWDSDTRADLIWDQDIAFADCSTRGINLSIGGADDRMDLQANSLVATLDNRDGRWTSLNEDGSSSDHRPGDPVQLWASDGVHQWWLFSGHITRWDRHSDETIELEAFDLFSDLSQSIGTWTPGSNGQKPGARLTSILQGGVTAPVPTRFATGVPSLTAQPTDKALLDEMEIVVSSDGGVIFCDADGTLVSFDRTWRIGRTDQPDIPTVSDNVCASPIVVWNPLLSTNDVGLADRVVCENVAKLHSSAGAGRHLLTETDLQYTSQAEGDALAAFVLDAQKQATLSVETFDLHLLDPEQPALKRMLDTRLFDKLTFLHDALTDAGIVQRVTLSVLVTSITHSITPYSWMMTIGTTKSFGFQTQILYNTGALYNDGNLYGY